jgi:hypothetical protein
MVEESAERRCSAITFDNQTRSEAMKRITFAVTTTLILGAHTITLPKLKSGVQANPVANPAAPFGDSCKNVKFKFTNQRSDSAKIRFQRVRYFNEANGAWQSEDVKSFLLKRAPIIPEDRQGAYQQKITIPRDTDMVRLRMKIEKGDSRRFQATIRTFRGSQVWSQQSLKPRSGVITVNVPADKLSVNDYFLTLSVTTPMGGTEEIDRYVFRVVRK